MATAALVHRYQPRGAAVQILECRAPEVLTSGPAGTGKSRACLQKIHLMCLRNPGMRALIVRKTLASLGSTALTTWREHVVAEALLTGDVVFYGGSAEHPAQYRYSNGSVVIIGGLDRPTKIMSSEYDIAFCQEAIELTENDWESITTRLRNGVVSFQQIIGDTNPAAPTHWLKARCDRGTTVMLESRHEDNPVLFDEAGQLTPRGAEYMSRLDALTGVRYNRLRKGLWVAAEGIVYDGFDPAIHVVDRFDIPPSWPRYWAIDWGYSNPFVWQCWAEDPDGRLYLYREIYQTQRIVQDHATQIMGIVAPGGRWIEPKPRVVVADHDAEDRETFRRHTKLPTTPANKTVKLGIEAVMTRLRPAGDGRARLFLLRDSLVERDDLLDEAKKPCATVEEFPGYVWSPPKEDKPVKEEVVKVDDHGLDALRYVVAHLDLGGRPRIRHF